ncbi:hypothetical protein LLOABG_LLOABG_12310, partial [Dysosmobacter welbionis]
GLLPWHEDEAGHRRGPEPQPQAAGAGRGHCRPGPHRPGRGAGDLQRVHPGGGPLHPDLLPHFERPGEAVRLYRLPPPGAAAVLRREGSAAGGVWHLRGHGRSSEQPSGRGRGSPGEQQLRRRPVPGEAGAGACGLGAGAAHSGGYRPVFGERSEGAMSALLLKDYYVIFRQMKIFLLLILVFSCIPGTFYSTF